MKRVLAVLLAALLTSGLAAARPSARRPTLTFLLAAGVSDYDVFTGPLGGGICLGGARVTDPKADIDVSWSPDGRRLAFTRETGPLTADVFVADANGSHLRNLTRGSAEFSWSPDWSPDGAGIVFVASDPDIEQLITIRPDGSARHSLSGTAADPNAQVSRPRWTPDGSLIGYVRSGDIHLVQPDGSGDRILVPNAYSLAWSPDGKRMAFTRDGDLALADSDGSDVVFVTHTAYAAEVAPAFSPDGSQLEYSSLDNAPRGVQGPGDHMYLTDPEGGHRRELHSPGGFGWFVGWRPAAPPPKGMRACVLRGTNRADVLVGTPKGDLIYGRGGNDVVRGRGGDDVIVGDAPYSAHPGKDRLYGGPGRDFIDSYDGRHDVVDGGAGRDRANTDRHDRVRSIELQG
jgi:dipeptidyl aminopeptidase/acylaminoacyl peptidase